MDDAWYANEPPDRAKAKQTFQLIPYCTGACTPNSKGIKKELIGRPVYCPDCGYALYYHRVAATTPDKAMRRAVAMGD